MSGPAKETEVIGDPAAVRTAGQLAAYRAADAFRQAERPVVFGSKWDDWLTYAWHYIRSHIPLNEIVRLCPETRDYLYRRHTPCGANYSPGARPLLEAVVADVVFSRMLSGDGCGNRAKARFDDVRKRVRSLQPAQEIAETLAQWVYWEVFRRGEVNRQGKWTGRLIEGGSEEQVLAFHGRSGSWDCSRVLACMLQVMEMPARLVFLFGSDGYRVRVGVEAYFDGGWRFFDLAANMHYVDRSGGIACLYTAATDPYCLKEGVRGRCDPHIEPGDRGAFDQLAVANYPIGVIS